MVWIFGPTLFAFIGLHIKRSLETTDAINEIHVHTSQQHNETNSMKREIHLHKNLSNTFVIDSTNFRSEQTSNLFVWNLFLIGLKMNGQESNLSYCHTLLVWSIKLSLSLSWRLRPKPINLSDGYEILMHNWINRFQHIWFIKSINQPVETSSLNTWRENIEIRRKAS